MLRIFGGFRLFQSSATVCKRFLSSADVAEGSSKVSAFNSSHVFKGSTEDSLREESSSKGSTMISKHQYTMNAIETLKLNEYPYYVEKEWWKRGKRMTFWATWRQLRDVKRRETVQETGADRIRLKALKENTILPQAIRDEAAEKLFKMPKYSHPRLVLNMCMFTGRQRGKIKPYRVNRHIFRKLADHSQLSGVQRAMW